MQRPLSLRRLAPTAATALRPICGVLCGLALYRGAGTAAMWWFLLGYLTDVVDGALARALGVASEAGRRLDGVADLSFSISFGGGLAARAVQDRDLVVLLVLAILLIGAIVNRRWIRSHSVIGKSVAGLYRVAWFLLLWRYVPEADRTPILWIAIGVAITTYVYEGMVTNREFRAGERSLK